MSSCTDKINSNKRQPRKYFENHSVKLIMKITDNQIGKFSSQSFGEFSEKPLRVFKEERDHFNHKVWIALILQLLKLCELIIKKTLLTHPKIKKLTVKTQLKNPKKETRKRSKNKNKNKNKNC